MTSVSGDKHAAELNVCDQLRVKMDSLDAMAKDEKIDAKEIFKLCGEIHQLASQGKEEGIGKLSGNMQAISSEMNALTNQVRGLAKKHLPQPSAAEKGQEVSPFSLKKATDEMKMANLDFDDAAVNDIVRKMETTERKAAAASKRVIPAGGLVIGGSVAMFAGAGLGFVAMTGVLAAFPIVVPIILGLFALGVVGIVAGFAFGGRMVAMTDPDAVKSASTAIKELSKENPDLLKRVLLVKQHKFSRVSSLSQQQRESFLKENKQFLDDLVIVYKRMKGDAPLPKDFEAKTKKLDEMIETFCMKPVLAEKQYKNIHDVLGNLNYLEGHMWFEMNCGRPDVLIDNVENLLKLVPKTE